MGRRNQHSREQQREMALDAASSLIAAEGLAGFSMRKVALAMGYTVGNLYLLFSNQDDLLAEVSLRTADAMHAYLEGVAAKARTPLDQIQAIAHGYITFAQKHSFSWRLMFEHRLPPEKWDHPGLDAKQRAMFEFVEQHLAPLLPEASPKELRSAATALWSSVHGLCVLASTGKLNWSGLKDAKPLSDLIVRVFVAGLQQE
ncbi:MAG TPA: TetR/AcrR family transcriptional regulator [Nevskia sp.]|nr:TetR/AcrR family transcriptional regulator [Nevskia sp.]